MKLARLISAHGLTIFSFLTVGAISALVNFSSFGVLWKFFGLNYQVATSIAYILSVIVHFNGNRHVTFKSQDISLLTQLPKYLSLVLLNYVITLCVMYGVVEFLHLSPYFGNIAAIGMTVGSGYLISRYWVFI